MRKSAPILWPTSRDRAPINPDTATATGHQTADEAEDADLEKMQGRSPRIELSVHATESKPGLLHGSPGHVFLVFLKLGLTSFGGPVAHLGYFHEEFVARRRWLDARSYADLVALCQFLPGPASSQVGLAIGLSRAGYAGALAAWAGFTLPSAVLLVLFAYSLVGLERSARHGLARWPQGCGRRRRRPGGARHGPDAGSRPSRATSLPWRPRSWPWRFPQPGARSAPSRWVARSASRCLRDGAPSDPRFAAARRARAPLRWPRSAPSLAC